MNKKKLILIILTVMILLAFLLFMRTPYWTALTKSKDHFIENANNKRILYEPGAKEYSDKFADYFTIAVKTIEEKHFNPFPEPFKVYVCNTQKSFIEYAVAKSFYPVRGTALRGDIYLAPSAFNFKGLDTHKQTLIHELSHLHFRQRLGFFTDRKIPQWFREGFADYVAGSGGEGIEEREAINFILNGRHFILDKEGKIFASFHKALNGLSRPMFHKQVKMFVTYIAESDSLKFKSLVLKIQNGESFKKSFKEIMETDIQGKWVQFMSYLRTNMLNLNN